MRSLKSALLLFVGLCGFVCGVTGYMLQPTVTGGWGVAPMELPERLIAGFVGAAVGAFGAVRLLLQNATR
jgi:hypothetical protein